jgi:peptide/nickel transport system substrate-binding protein
MAHTTATDRPIRAARRASALIAAAAVLTLSTTLLAGNARAQSDEKIVFTVGVTTDIDSFNLNVGYTVEAYEAWNLHYPTLTDFTDEDFAPQGALAESWEGAGQEYTYTIRDGLVWSDGEPLTAEDIAYTINRSRDEEWINHSSITANLTAEALDPTTLRVTSSVKDPRLPAIPMYVVPKHVYETVSADDMASHDATKDPGAGPFILTEWKTEQFWRMEANDNYFRGRPAVDEVVFKYYSDQDALVAALQAGEVDASANIDADNISEFDGDDTFTVIYGNQGTFSELSVNPGDNSQGGHNPVLEDLQVRIAIAHSIDRELLIDRVLDGHGQPAATMTPGASPSWDLDIPEDEQYLYDLDRANQILDDAGYVDSDGNGIREDTAGNDIDLRLFILDDATNGEFVEGMVEELGFDVTVRVFDSGQLGTKIAEGDYDMFLWGWTPFVDPDPMLSYFTCDQISGPEEVESGSYGYNDASWCNEEYDELYKRQNQELDPDVRRDLVQQMLKLFHDDAAYVALYKAEDINVFNNTRFGGFNCQPTDTGPMLFTNSSSSYANLVRVESGVGAANCGDRDPNATPVDEPGEGSTPATDGGAEVEIEDSSDNNTGLIVGGVAIGLALIAGVGFAVRRKGSADDRD